MDLNALRVFNAIHNLGISEAEFQSIKEVGTGTEYILRKGNSLIAIDHDNKHAISIIENIDVPVPSRVLCKTLITFEPPPEIFELHSIGKYRSSDESIKHTANNLEELKERILDRFADDYDKQIAESQFRLLFWLFSCPAEDITIKYRKNLNTIIKVFVRGNRRLAIIKQHRSWTSHGWGYIGENEHEEENFILHTFKPSDPEFNYVCEGREFKSNVWIDDAVVKPNELDLIVKHSNEFVLLTKKKFNNFQNMLRLEMRATEKETEDETIKQEFIEKIEAEFKKGKVIRDGITISKDKIEYEGLELVSDDLFGFICNKRLIYAETLDFNSVVAAFVDHILDRDLTRSYYGNKITVNVQDRKIKIGKHKIIIKKIKNNIYVNNYKVRSDELHEILKAAVVEADYESYLKNVSRCSLRLQNVLKSGLGFKLEIDRVKDNYLIDKAAEIYISLKIIREKDKNYLILKDKKLSIQDLSTLFELKHVPDPYHQRLNGVQRFIKILFKSIKDIKPEDIGIILEDGKKTYFERLNRSYDFIKNAVRITKAIKKLNGYVVTGLSGKKYYIDEDRKVWEMIKNKPEKYLCIIDVDADPDDIVSKNDCIARRILALHQDKLVAKDIYTLGDGIDRHWLELENGQNKIQEPNEGQEV